MSAIKVVVIVLALIAVLFIVIAVVGIHRRDTEGTGSSETADTFSGKPHPALDSVNSMVARFAPRLSAKALSPSLTSFNLALRPGNQIVILPDASEKFRQLPFVVTPTKQCAHITYTPHTPLHPTTINKKQDSADSGSKSNPERFAFLVFSDGGTLEIDRAVPVANGPCTVILDVKQ